MAINKRKEDGKKGKKDGKTFPRATNLYLKLVLPLMN